MAAGDTTASTPVVCTGGTAVKTAIDALNLASATDVIMVVPYSERDQSFLVFKVERA